MSERVREWQRERERGKVKTAEWDGMENKTNCGEVVLAEQDEAEDVVFQI